MKTDTHGVQSAYRCLCPYRRYSDGNANLCKWHPVEGQVINFSVTPEGATLSGGKVRTNSSGQAPVVLTSNKVGTYTVTASFHNGVTIQTQTTVKVTGNSSTAHVASFIADPSTIAATNTDLSTLKATVEDGSGNLIEGLTVYFALKAALPH